jgi:hypothetical protein
MFGHASEDLLYLRGRRFRRDVDLNIDVQRWSEGWRPGLRQLCLSAVWPLRVARQSGWEDSDNQDENSSVAADA